MIGGPHGSMLVRGVAGICPVGQRRAAFESGSQIPRRDVIGQHPCHAMPSVTLPGIRRIPGDFEAKIALLTCLGNGKSPRHRQQAIEARG